MGMDRVMSICISVSKVIYMYMYKYLYSLHYINRPVVVGPHAYGHQAPMVVGSYSTHSVKYLKSLYKSVVGQYAPGYDVSVLGSSSTTPAAPLSHREKNFEKNSGILRPLNDPDPDSDSLRRLIDDPDSDPNSLRRLINDSLRYLIIPLRPLNDKGVTNARDL